MTPTPATGAAAELPKTAWSYIPSDAWRDRVLTDDPEKVEIALGFGREVIALTPHAPAQSLLDALREEVARLTKERDEWKARVAAMEGETTVPDGMQEWARLDGAVAWHLIERHADSWADVGKMMDEFIVAKIAASRHSPPTLTL